MSPSKSTVATTGVPTFGSLGVRSLINCRGTLTIISGSRMLDQSAEAMVEASNHYVHMDELMDKVGERLAELTGAEWGYITSGAAAALCQITAACIAGADPEKMARLPDTTGMRSEVISQKAHRHQYDRAIRMAGARMIDVVTKADLLAAISERTAMIAMTRRAEGLGRISPQEMIEIAHAQGIPCMVDAAAVRPDMPDPYLEMGADATIYSGGKCLHGPQSSGLVLGKKSLLQAAFLNGAPHHAVGRPMKAGKEEIMGLLAAVEAWISGRDHEAEWRTWDGYIETICSAVSDILSLNTYVDQAALADHVPTLKITWDPDVLHVTPAQVHQELEDGDPCIVTNLRPGGLPLVLYMMERGNDAIVARRLRELLSNRPAQALAKVLPPAQVAGMWEIRTHYVVGESKHAMTLEQEGAAFKGTYRAQYACTDVTGEVNGDHVEFTTLLGYQTNAFRYAYSGTIEGDTMRGVVSLDEFRSADWMATRVG